MLSQPPPPPPPPQKNQTLKKKKKQPRSFLRRRANKTADWLHPHELRPQNVLSAPAQTRRAPHSRQVLVVPLHARRRRRGRFDEEAQGRRRGWLGRQDSLIGVRVCVLCFISSIFIFFYFLSICWIYYS